MGEQRIPSRRKSIVTSNEALYDDIQPWMQNSVRGWVQRRFKRKSSSTTWYQNELMHDVELHARLTFGKVEDGYSLYAGAITVFDNNQIHALDIVQAIVELCSIVDKHSYDQRSIPNTEIDQLNRILIAGGSKWHIVISGSKAKLEARVNQTTTSAYTKLINADDDFAPLLKKSWEYAYGRAPNPSEAYTFAIKAVEAAGWRIITPKNTKSTLGTMIKDLEAQAQAGKFATAFFDKKEEDTIDMLVRIMRRLWEGQTDRHATGDYITPTQQEAEAAVHFAITLCHLFSSGIIVRV